MTVAEPKRIRTSGTVVIGAGPAGLAVSACLAKRGLAYELLERRDAVGSSWRGHYKRLHLHTDKALSHLPFVPFAPELPTWVPRERFVSYMDAYAKQFDIKPRFGTEIVKISKEQDGFNVETAGATLHAREVVVATGYNRIPSVPAFGGEETFGGPIIHSSQYADGAAFRGKRVLVVGAGNSGAEIAIDLWEHGAHPRISIRGPIHVVPRDLFGLPIQRLSVGLKFLSAEWMDRLAAPLAALVVGDLSRYGLKRPTKGAAVTVRDEGRIPLVDVGTISLIRQGLLPVLPGIRRFSEGAVECVDGSRHSIDVVVLATGYRSGLSAVLDTPLDGLLDHKEHPKIHGTAALGGLFFIGFSNPQTGALREIAIEAQRIAEQIAARRSRS